LVLDVPSSKNNTFLKDFLKSQLNDEVNFRTKAYIHEKDKNKYRVHHRMICPKKYCKPP
jgi:hypothetical protein